VKVGRTGLKPRRPSVDKPAGRQNTLLLPFPPPTQTKEQTLLRELTQRIRQNRGFTLIELLVVILLIGVLAAIAIPSYMDHQKKGKDSEAQSNARNLVSRVELCFATEETYANCDTNEKIGGDTNLPYGTGVGEVSIVTADQDSYIVTAKSKAKSDDTNHTFTIEHTVQGVNNRTCTAGSTNDNGSCRDGSW
jgi:type IV pilus assembly protein PilA